MPGFAIKSIDFFQYLIALSFYNQNKNHNRILLFAIISGLKGIHNSFKISTTNMRFEI
jgi:hypothetical protein